MKLNSLCQEPHKVRTGTWCFLLGESLKHLLSTSWRQSPAEHSPLSSLALSASHPSRKQGGIMDKPMCSAARWPEFKSLLLVCELEDEALHLTLRGGGQG